jgi:CTP:phosphocholine cytidylyltransferase-like protein
MQLTRDQFAVLSFLAEQATGGRAGEAGPAGFSLEVFTQIFIALTNAALVSGRTITPQGFAALEPYRVKRAIFIAAGFGSRMVPITLNTPKPLVRVKGTRIIDTLLDAVLAAGIYEIYIVRGYLGEQFDQLRYKYPMIRFLENPLYNEANNISSALCARYFFENAYVFESDLFLRNPKLISPYQYVSNYLGVPVEATDDWCLETTDGRVSKFAHSGRNCYHMFGISYWTREDGARLAEHLKQVFDMPGERARLWDFTPLEIFLKDYRVEVRECTYDDVCEIDSFAELQTLDDAYQVK